MTIIEFLKRRITHNQKRLNQLLDIPENIRTIHAIRQIAWYEGRIDGLDMVIGELEKIVKKKTS